MVNHTILNVDSIVFLVLRQTSKSSKDDESNFFFCNKLSITQKGQEHLVQSFRLVQRVGRCANVLEDSFLHEKLQKDDMIAQDAVYRKACSSNLYRTTSSKQLRGYFSDEQRRLSFIAFGEVVEKLSYHQRTKYRLSNYRI